MKRNSLILFGIILFTLIFSGLPSIIENSPNATKEPDNKEVVEELKGSEWISGYNYSMNTNAPYSWIEINETGTNITDRFEDGGGLDDGHTGISFFGQGWNFTFYGTEYNTVNVSTNGFMSFSGQGDLESSNCYPIPQNGTVKGEYNDTAFLLHLDIVLDPGSYGGGSVFYKFGGAAPNRYLVIEYFQVNNYTNDNAPHLVGDFEAIFYENGDIKFQYKLVRDLVYEPDQHPVVGLDHGDLINYSNYTDNWSNMFAGDVEELAVYFSLNKNPPPSGGGGGDDDDDEEAAIPGPDILLISSITVLAIIALAFKLKNKFK